MNIIRLLNLSKQHYLKEYNNASMAIAKYSCWGYFDCMDVQKVTSNQNERLLISEGNVNLTDLWYEISSNIEKLNGCYGQQNIGLFRYEDAETKLRDEEFWDNNNEGILLIACLIQFGNIAEIGNTLLKIENNTAMIDEDRGISIQSISYRTLDNVDAILFIKGNSYKGMTKMVAKICKEENVKYTYSISGISQKFLDESSHQIDTYEYNNNILVNDDINKICLEFIANGKVNMNDFLNKLGLKGKYGNVLGAIDNVVHIEGANMKQVIKLLQNNDAGITHLNTKYGKEIYNITTILLPEMNVSHNVESENDKAEESKDDKTDNKSEWCNNEMETLKKFLPAIKMNCNEMFYSYCLAMIQTLNVLAQYENANFSKDIFRIIFPSIKMISSQFRKLINFDTIMIIKDRILKMDSILKYINAVDCIIRHSVHTSQNFFAIPGSSGTLYDIPTKLLLLYMAYANKLIDLLNDSNDKFAIYIWPDVDSKPRTKEIILDTNNNNDEYLIEIKLSQRHLYMPRSLMIIFAHEMAHYCGEETRCRKKRGTNMIKMCAYAISYILLGNNQKNQNIFDKITLRRENELQEYLVLAISEKVKKELESKDNKQKYYFSLLQPALINACYVVLNDDNKEIHRILRTIDDDFWKEIEKEKVKEYIINWNKKLIIINDIKDRLVVGDELDNIVKMFVRNYREIYADLACIICMNLDLKYYFETFNISEGINLNEEIGVLLLNRLAVVINTLLNEKKWHDQWKKLINDKKEDKLISSVNDYIKKFNIIKKKGKNKDIDENSIFNIDEYQFNSENWPFYNLDAIWLEQNIYAENCFQELKKRLNQKKDEAIEIQNFFQMFKKYPLNQDYSYKEWFDQYDKFISDYNYDIDHLVKEE